MYQMVWPTLIRCIKCSKKVTRRSRSYSCKSKIMRSVSANSTGFVVATTRHKKQKSNGTYSSQNRVKVSEWLTETNLSLAIIVSKCRAIDLRLHSKTVLNLSASSLQTEWSLPDESGPACCPSNGCSREFQLPLPPMLRAPKSAASSNVGPAD